MRISEDARKCVVFFGVPGSKKPIEYGGTGFLVSLLEGDHRYCYLVTCRHVAKALEAHEDTGFFIRVNLKDGGSEAGQFDSIEWQYPDDQTVDLAACELGFGPRVDQLHFPLGPSDILSDTGELKRIGCGDDVSLVGLFRLHAGSKRNVPLVHSGHIAALPDESERVPVRNRTTNKIEQSSVYLVEAQTLDGLSGSPVFVHEIITISNMRLDGQPGKNPTVFCGVSLLGIYSGSWDGEPGKILEEDRNLRGAIRVPVGMGTVVPAIEIEKLLRGNPLFMKKRRDFAERVASETAAVTDSALPAAQPNGENPTHREDFNSLVGAAARKQRQDD